MQTRCPGKNRSSSVSIFSSKLKCGHCGSWFGSKVWHSNDKYRRVIWQCNHKFQEGCTTPHFDEDTIKAMFIKVSNILARQKDDIIPAYEEIERTAFDTAALVAEQKRLQEELNVVVGLIEQSIANNARVAQDQDEYERNHRLLEERYDAVKSSLEKTSQSILDLQAGREEMKAFIAVVKAMPDAIEVFVEDSWCALVDYVTVNGTDDVVFTLKGGMEIRM